MKKLLTLEEWSPLKFNGELKYNKTDMIEFAKMCVEAALKEVNSKVKRKEGSIIDNKLSESILKSKTLNNIK